MASGDTTPSLCPWCIPGTRAEQHEKCSNRGDVEGLVMLKTHCSYLSIPDVCSCICTTDPKEHFRRVLDGLSE